MKPAVKSAVESALIAAAVAILCLWMLVSANADGEPSAGKALLLSLGLGAGVIAHWAYMAIAMARDGRRVIPWTVGLVLLCPVTTVVALVLLSQGSDSEQATHKAQTS